MLKKVKITRVFVNDCPKDSDIPYVYKKGKYEGQHFQRVAIKTEETGDEMYATNTLPGSRPTQLKEGDVVVLKLTEENGYKNFAFPTKAEQEVYDQLAPEQQ